MEDTRKKEIKETIRNIQRDMFDDLSSYEIGFRLSYMIPENNYSVACRWLSRYCGYKLTKIDENLFNYRLTGPEKYLKSLPIIPILTRTLIVILGLVFAVVGIALFLLSIVITLFQFPIYWVMTGKTIYDESTITFRYVEYVGYFINWIILELKLHRFLDLK